MVHILHFIVKGDELTVAEPDFSRTKSLIHSERPYTVKGRRNLGGRAIEEGKMGNLVWEGA